MLADNSGSMEFEEGGERKQDLKLILSRVAYAASLFDDDGIQVRFMNMTDRLLSKIHPRELEGITSEEQAANLVERATYSGLTPLGTQLDAQIIEPLILQKARNNQLRKPVLVITITDGQPAGEPIKTLANVISKTTTEMGRLPRYGPQAVSFEFAQVGNDQVAREFLANLDTVKEFGDIVDCTSSPYHRVFRRDY
jgi:hypothetical protein